MSLVPRIVLGDLDLTDYPFGVEFDYDLGAGQNVATEVLSQLRDGEVISSNRTSNREASFSVIVEGSDFDALAEYEGRLVLEGDKPLNSLSVDPGDGYGAVTVFDTFRAQVVPVRSEGLEAACLRRYLVTIPARPFGHAETATILGADAVSDTVSIKDDCESTTGWAPRPGATGNVGDNPTFAVDSTAGNFLTGTGSIKVSPDGSPQSIGGFATSFASFQKTLSIAASVGYLSFALKTTWPAQVYEGFITTAGGGREQVTFTNGGALGNGFSRYSAPIPHNSTITLLEIEVWQSLAGPGPDGPQPPLWVDSIATATASSNAQKFRSFDVGGSVRTEGTFAVSSPAGIAGLGDVVLYTSPDRGDGFRPDLRRWQVGGTSTVDSTAVTGTYATLTSTATVLEAPLTSFRPGAYAVLARLKSNNAQVSFGLAAQMVQGSSLVGGVETVSAALTTPTNEYVLHRIGVIYLPPTVVDPTNTMAEIRFSVTIASPGIDVRLDELLVFPMEEAALTWVKCGVGTPSAAVSSRLWLDGPSVQYPRGQLVVGNDADRLDGRIARPLARGSHLLYPGRMFSYMLATGANTATMEVSYYRAFHTHATSSDG